MGVLYLVVCSTGFNANASAAIGQQKLDVCVVTNRRGFSALARARLERALERVWSKKEEGGQRTLN